MNSDDLPVKSTTKMDKEYLALVGETIFLYNTFEETLAGIIDEYRPGFWSDYFCLYRFNPSDVFKHFVHIIKHLDKGDPDKLTMQSISSDYLQAIDIRSAVAHSRPSTDVNDNNRQVLTYQTGTANPPKPGQPIKVKQKNGEKLINFYSNTQLTYAVLKKACEELEEGCSNARTFYDAIRNRKASSI